MERTHLTDHNLVPWKNSKISDTKNPFTKAVLEMRSLWRVCSSRLQATENRDLDSKARSAQVSESMAPSVLTEE